MWYEQPAHRKPLRMFLGKTYYTFRRHLQCWLSSVNYAKKIGAPSLSHLTAEHHTPLYRSLRNVEMELQQNKVVNLTLASQRIHGLILQPGQTFSFWQLVGKPTHKKGYKEGMVLHNGSFSAGIGGGLCQLSNLIYWMTIHTPLTVVERWRHNYDVFPDSRRTQPFGSGATVVYNYVDLQIRNDTKDTWQLELWLDEENLYGCWRSTSPLTLRYEIYEREHHFLPQPWGGYVRSNVIGRRVYDLEGNLLRDEHVADNHGVTMYEPLLGQGAS